MGSSGMDSEARKALITKKAQELCTKRGGTPGHELDDWLEAEKAVDREIQAAKPIGSGPAPNAYGPRSRPTSPR